MTLEDYFGVSWHALRIEELFQWALRLKINPIDPAIVKRELTPLLRRVEAAVSGNRKRKANLALERLSTAYAGLTDMNNQQRTVLHRMHKLRPLLALVRSK